MITDTPRIYYKLSFIRFYLCLTFLQRYASTYLTIFYSIYLPFHLLYSGNYLTFRKYQRTYEKSLHDIKVIIFKTGV